VKTEDLIVKLAAEAGPVQPVASVGTRLLRWGLAATASAAVMVMFARPRPDVTSLLTDPAYVFTTATILALAVASAIAALSLSVPNDRRSAAIRLAPFAAAGAWGVLLAVRLAGQGPVFSQLFSEPVHLACLLQISAVALVPAVVLVGQVRRAAPLDTTWSGIFAVAASLGAGAVSSAIICPIDRIAHQTWWHYLPVLSLAALGVIVGARWLARFRSRFS